MVSFAHASSPFATADLLSHHGYAYDWRGRRAAGSLGQMIGDGCTAVLYPDRVLVRGRNTQPLIALLAEHTPPPLQVISPRTKVRPIMSRDFTVQPLCVLAHVDDLGAVICLLIKSGFKIDVDHLQRVGDDSPVRVWRNAEGWPVQVEHDPNGGDDGMVMTCTALAYTLFGVEVKP